MNFIFTIIIYASLAVLFGYRIFYHDPRIINLSVAILIIWIILFTFITLSYILVSLSQALVMSKIKKGKDLNPTEQTNLDSMLKRKSQKSYKEIFFFTIFFVITMLIAIDGYTMSSVWLVICELTILFLNVVTAARVIEFNKIQEISKIKDTIQ